MTPDKHQTVNSSAAVLTKATLRAAERLGVEDASLACIIGVDVVEVLGYRRGHRAIALSSPAGGKAVLLIRAFRALDALVGGNARRCLAWMTGDNTALGGAPVQVIQQLSGLAATPVYLERIAGDALPPPCKGPSR